MARPPLRLTWARMIQTQSFQLTAGGTYWLSLLPCATVSFRQRSPRVQSPNSLRCDSAARPSGSRAIFRQNP